MTHSRRTRKPARPSQTLTQPPSVTSGVTLLSDTDLYYFNEGTHARLYEKLGAHPLTIDGVRGTYFAVWAPNATQVCVIGDFNDWCQDSHPLQPRRTIRHLGGFYRPGRGGSRVQVRYPLSTRGL